MTKFNIMVSSRCKTKISSADGEVELSDIRLEAKRLLEAAKLFDNEVFEVWISEEPQDINALESSWDACISQVEKSDLLVCIYTGEAGWAKTEGDIGICHAELEAGFNSEPSKVYIINASSAISSKPNASKADEVFQKYVANLNRFHSKADNKDQIIDSIGKISAKGIVALAKMGKREARKSKYNYGDALNWSRLNFSERSSAIIKTIKIQLELSGHTRTGDGALIKHVRKKHQLVIHGCPSSMSVSSAREIVGRPFLRDHLYVMNQGERVNGPIHLIGVHKGVTEQQALSVLGHPDAVVVEGAFGIYIADKVQNIQLVFLSNCRDIASTKHNVQRFISWLEESGESSDFYDRSEKRRKIIEVIIKQQSS